MAIDPDVKVITDDLQAQIHANHPPPYVSTGDDTAYVQAGIDASRQKTPFHLGNAAYEIYSDLIFPTGACVVGEGASWNTQLRMHDCSILFDGSAWAGGDYSFENTLRDIVVIPVNDGSPPPEVVRFGPNNYSNYLYNVRIQEVVGMGGVGIRHVAGNNTRLERVTIYGKTDDQRQNAMVMEGGSCSLIQPDFEAFAEALDWRGGLLDVHGGYFERFGRYGIRFDSDDPDSMFTMHGGWLWAPPSSVCLAFYNSKNVGLYGVKTWRQSDGVTGYWYGNSFENVGLYGCKADFNAHPFPPGVTVL